ncbi:CLUMA_CG015466, isoform A [Clunio marinus]|uniref:CLUMA_CG015466, isoform A n=1 Tax=Clunio marinus TaxID=568069 RepID=A0A1J1IQL1_9DIPT|nr:CLUMA_CG015466, isoform A [Clunio marinus]
MQLYSQNLSPVVDVTEALKRRDYRCYLTLNALFRADVNTCSEIENNTEKRTKKQTTKRRLMLNGSIEEDKLWLKRASGFRKREIKRSALRISCRLAATSKLSTFYKNQSSLNKTSDDNYQSNYYQFEWSNNKFDFKIVSSHKLRLNSEVEKYLETTHWMGST